MKTCAKCLKVKPIDEFYLRSGQSQTRRPNCKSCHLKAYNRNYAKNKSKGRERNARYYLKLRKEVESYLGGKCCQCGFSDPRALHIDHIKGGGYADRKSRKFSHTSMYRNILIGTPGYQLLCANCNQIKRHTHKEFAYGA